jgi:rubredoxin
MTVLYNDKYIQIFEDRIKFKAWVLPWGKKEVKIDHIKKISEKKMGTFSGKLRISGTGNFRDWFHYDAERPKKEKAIVLETDFKIYKRLWLTPENHGQAFNTLNKIFTKK